MRIAHVGLLASLLVCSVSVQAAIESVGGEVNFRGRLVVQPCVVVSDSVEVIMEPISVKELQQNGGIGPPKAFSIGLTQCNTSVISSVVVLFEGMDDPVLNGRLQTKGKAKGVALRLLNGDRTIIDLNTPAKTLALQDGDNLLPFLVYVEAQKTVPIEGGDFTANASFKLSYQ